MIAADSRGSQPQGSGIAATGGKDLEAAGVAKLEPLVERLAGYAAPKGITYEGNLDLSQDG